jgi:tetratricopeptide (TPR) repeat protein
MQDLDLILLVELNAVYRTAKATVEAGDFDTGLELAENAWARLPEPKFDWDASKMYALALAALYRDTQNYEKGEALMKELFASGTVKPYQAEPYFMLGTIYFEMGDLQNAEKWLKDAHEISKADASEINLKNIGR